MAILFLMLDVLGVLAQAEPKIAPMVRDIYEMIRGKQIEDITQEEFESRIDAAIAKLPKWE